MLGKSGPHAGPFYPKNGDDGLLAGRYRLEAVIGRGGMATVWRAADRRLGRTVAIKEITLLVGDAERETMRARALREAHAAARINHPAAVAVYDVVDEDERLFIVMELVDAVSLADRVRAGGPLDPASVAALGARLCDAVEAAHRVGVVHRDVKPANVLLPNDGTGAKLADFGIASLGDDPRLTTTGMVVGSPAYMAPEQARGNRATGATDLWGIGSTLYFAVEGAPPFDRDTTLATLGAVVNEPPRPIRRAGPLAPVLLALLDKDPDRRPPLPDTRRRLLGIADGGGEVTAAATAVVAPYSTLVAPASPPPPEAVAPPTRGPAVPAPAPVRDRERRFGWQLVAIPVLLVVLAAAAIAIVARDGDRNDGATDSTVPPIQFVTYTDPETRFTLRHPAGWELTTIAQDHITDVVDPDTGMLIRVQWRVPPADDPVEEWEDLSARFVETREAYQELRIDAAEFKGFPAAEWEFTHVDAGTTLHTLDIGMVAGDFGFAILLRAPEDRWDDLADVREEVLAGFVPATDAPDPPPEEDDDDEEEEDEEDGDGNRGNGNRGDGNRGNGNGRDDD